MANENQKVMKAVVDTGGHIDPSQVTMRLALFDVDGDPIDLGDVPTGAEVKLTGFVPGAAGAVAAADSVNQAIAKLQARIVALESA